MGPALEVSMGMCGGIGGRFFVGLVLVRDIRMTLVPMLGLFLGPPNGIG